MGYGTSFTTEIYLNRILFKVFTMSKIFTNIVL